MIKQNCLIHCGDHLDNQRRVLSLAIHLKNNGYNPIVLLYSHDERLFKSHGIETIKYYIYRDSVPLSSSPDFDIDFNDVCYVEMHRAPQKFLKSQLSKRKNEIRRDFLFLYDIIKNYAIDIVFVWNGFTGNIANILRCISEKMKLKSYYLERGFNRDSLFIDRSGANAASEFSKMTGSELTGYSRNESQVSFNRNVKNEELLLKYGLGGNKIIFVPLQVQTDTNNILYSRNVKSMRELVLSIYKSIDFDFHENLVIVVREHPEETNKKLNLPRLKNVKYINEGDINDWCDLSDLVVNINSTVGMQSILRGCPTISLGESIYSNKGIDIPSGLNDLRIHVENVLSGNYQVSFEKINLFYQSLMEFTQCSLQSIPKCLIDDLKLQVKEYTNNLLPSEKVEFAKNKFGKNETFRVLVKIKRTDFLNLTYRNSKVELTEELVRSGFMESWNKDIRFMHDARIYSSKNIEGDVDIVISDDVDDCKNYKHSLVFNKYMVPLL